MPDRSRVPVKTLDFNDYIESTARFLFQTDPGSGLPNWHRLGLSPAKATEWQNMESEWKNRVFENYMQPALRTKVAVDEVQNFKKKFRAFASPLLNKMAASDAASNLDENIFRFKRTGKNQHRSYRKEPITESCQAEASPQGGGWIRVKCKTPDRNGNHLPPGADAVQVSFDISSEPKVTIDVTLRREVFSRARFMLQASFEDRSKWLSFCVRWYNTKHPHLSGPWSDVYHAVIA